MMTLFLAANTISVAAHIALEEADIDHELAWVDLAKNEQTSTAYLKLNPKGRVPALVTANGTLTETPAILRYLATLAPNIAPTGDWDRAEMDEWLSYFASTLHVAHAHKMRGHRWTDDPAAQAALAAYVPTSTTAACTYIERRLPADGYVMGAFSVVDAHLFALARWMESDGVVMTDHPRLAAHLDRMRNRPSVIKVEALHG